MSNYVGNEPGLGALLYAREPVGMIGFFHAPPDSSWLRVNGQVFAKAIYPDLWTYAQGFLTADQVANPGLYKDVDAANFALPKLDGLFIRAQGTLDANHVSAALGVKQADDNLAHTHFQNAAPSSFSGATGVATGILTGSQTGSSGGTEARPVNVALVPCVKALRTVIIPLVSDALAARVAALEARMVPLKVVTFTRDTALASGTQAITGVGFKPRAVMLFATITPLSAVGQASHGMASDGAPVGNSCVACSANIAANSWIEYTNACAALLEGGATQYVGAVTSFDADGFTLTWTKTGAKTGTATLQAFCLP